VPAHFAPVDRREECIFAVQKMVMSKRYSAGVPLLVVLPWLVYLSKSFLSADRTNSNYVGAYGPFGLGKTTLATMLANLPAPLIQDLRLWAHRCGGLGAKDSLERFLQSWYLCIDVSKIPAPQDEGVQSLEQAMAALLYKTIFGADDRGFDKVA